jgi:predicted permease
MENLGTTIFTLLLIIVISSLAKYFRLMPENSAPVMTRLLTNVTLPALIFVSVAGGPGLAAFEEGLVVGGQAIMYFSVAMPLAWFFMKKAPPSDVTRSVAAFGVIFPNTSFVGLPMVYLIYGREVVFLAAVFDMVQSLIMFSFGIMLIQGGISSKLESEPGQLSRVRSLSRVFLEPVVLALAGGVLVQLTGISLPGLVMEPFRMLGETTTVLAMFAIGQYLDLSYLRSPSYLLKLLPVSGLKLLVLPGVFLFLSKLFHLPPLASAVTTIMLASPAAVLTSVFAERYDRDDQFAVLLVVVTTGLCVVTLPFLLSFL